MHKILLSALMLVSLAAGAQNKRVDFVEYDLPNGLHVILHQDNSTPIVAVTVMYHVGSKNEDTARTGFAHFFEHLLFEGSQHIDRHQYDKYVSNAGGTLNANTSNDRTFYYEILPSNQLQLGLWLESERMLHAKVEQIGIETQREVVKEEKRQRIDNQPYASFISEVSKRAYKQHPYRWVPIGSMAHLDAAQEEDYVKFYRTFYVPHNAVLSIAGDINIEETKAQIQRYFGTIPTGPRLTAYRDLVSMDAAAFATKYGLPVDNAEKIKALKTTDERFAFLEKNLPKIKSEKTTVPRPNIVEPPLTGEIRDTVLDNIQLPGVILAYRIPQQGTPDFYALEMMSRVLSGGKSSRMQRVIVDEELKAIFAGSFSFPLEDPGLGLILGIANAGIQPEELERSMQAQIDGMQKELISEQEFQKVRNQMEAEFLTSNVNVAGIAESLANYHMYFGDANLANTELERYMKVTREDIQRVARKYFVNDNRVVLYYLPK
jgi:predicted Zn-dependent peptidase